MQAALAAPVPDPVFVALATAAVVRVASRAVVAADLALAAASGRPGRPAPPLGLLLPEDVAPRVAQGLRTLLEPVRVDALALADASDDELRAMAARVSAGGGLSLSLGALGFDTSDRSALRAAAARSAIAARAARLARAESLDAGHRAFTDGMTRRGTRGWTRVTGPDPCPLCAGLAARAEVLPPDWRMARHAGCSCVQRPVDLAPIAPPRRSSRAA